MTRPSRPDGAASAKHDGTGSPAADGIPRVGRRGLVLAAVLGLAILLVAGFVAWSWLDELPAEVASHWSGSGAPDGFSSPAGFVTPILLVGLGLLVLFLVIGTVGGATASTRRLMAGAAVWSGGFIGATLLTTLAPQRGLTDVTQVTISGWATALTLLVPLVPAVAVALLIPGDPARPASAPVPADAPRTFLGDGERAVWLRRAAGGRGLLVAVVAVAGTAAIAVVTQIWAMLALPVLLGVLFAAMFSFLVRVDAAGLSVRSSLGWPRTHIPAGEVERASAVDVHPFREFGGWGWRVGRGGRVGVVLRAGEGLLVERTGGRSFVVTVDGAEGAAGLLNTMAERAR